MKHFSQKLMGILSCLVILATLPVYAQTAFETWLKQKVEKNEIDLSKAFLVEAEGVLDQSGKINKNALRFLKTEGDPGMIEVGRKSIEEIAGNGLLRLLKDLGIEKLSISLQEDDRQISLVFGSSLQTGEKARSAAGSLNLMTSTAVNNKSEDEVTRWVLKYFNSSADDKKLTIGFWFPRQEMIQMIRERLKEVGK